MDTTKHQYLQAMGIPVWEERVKNNLVIPDTVVSDTIIPASCTVIPAVVVITASGAVIPAKAGISSVVREDSRLRRNDNGRGNDNDRGSDNNIMDDWGHLEGQTQQCQLCELSKTRTRVVFGCGCRQAKLMLIGEAPGATEDQQGQPFVGRAGMLLTAMLQAVGFQREQVYITNILKCRPPENRNPLPREIELCTPILEQQIGFIKPRLLVAVGRVAAQFLLNTQESLGKLRGRTYEYGALKTPLIITYHPAYLLRSPREKVKAYEDWLRISRFL